MTEKALLWNRFIEEICYQDMENLSEIQRIAVLCFWYDAEMNSGGYSGYMDCYPDTDPKELEKAILSVGGKELADTFPFPVVCPVGDCNKMYALFSGHDLCVKSYLQVIMPRSAFRSPLL